MTGAAFDHMALRDVRFIGCQLTYASLSMCKLQDAAFEECVLRGAYLNSCTQKELMLSRCDLSAAEVLRTPLTGVDLSTCKLEGIRSEIGCFRGVVISLDQAPLLLGLAEIQVKL